MAKFPEPSQTYQHFKGEVYEVISMATDAITDQDTVIYKNSAGKVYTRPFRSWNEMTVDETDQIHRRFQLLKKEAA